jgi:hypothetical protein
MKLRHILFPFCIFGFVTIGVHAQTSTPEYGIDFTHVTCNLGTTSNCYQSPGAYIDISGNVVGQALIAEGPVVATSSGPYSGQPNSLVRFNGIAPAGTTTLSFFSRIDAPDGVTGPAQTWLEIQDSSGNKYYVPAFSLTQSRNKK